MIMKVPAYMTQVLALVLTPQLVESAVKTVTEWFEEQPEKKTITHDTYKFTQMDYDIIIEEYNAFMERNENAEPGEREVQMTLVNLLNARLRINKCRTSYYRVWSGKVKRHTLASGQFN